MPQLPSDPLMPLFQAQHLPVETRISSCEPKLRLSNWQRELEEAGIFVQRLDDWMKKMEVTLD